MRLQRAAADAKIIEQEQTLTAIKAQIRSNRDSIKAQALEEMQKMKIQKILAMDRPNRLAVHKAEKEAIEAGIKLFDQKMRTINEAAQTTDILQQMKDKKYKESEAYRQHQAYLKLLEDHQKRMERGRETQTKGQEKEKTILANQERKRQEVNKQKQKNSQQENPKTEESMEKPIPTIKGSTLDFTKLSQIPKKAQIIDKSYQNAVSSIKQPSIFLAKPQEPKTQQKNEQANFESSKQTPFPFTPTPPSGLFAAIPSNNSSNSSEINHQGQKNLLVDLKGKQSSAAFLFGPANNTSGNLFSAPKQLPIKSDGQDSACSSLEVGLFSTAAQANPLFGYFFKPQSQVEQNDKQQKPLFEAPPTGFPLFGQPNPKQNPSASKSKQKSSFDSKPSTATSLFAQLPQTTSPFIFTQPAGGNKPTKNIFSDQDNVKSSFEWQSKK